MDHNDFDRIFSDKLKETQEFEFMESDWENVLGRIEVPEERKRRGGWLMLFSLGFLMMAGTSLYLATSLRKTNQYLVELTETMAKNAIRVDTVVKEVKVVEYDTVLVYRSSTPSSIPTASGQAQGLKTNDQRPKTSTAELASTSLTNSNFPLLSLAENNHNSDWLNSTEQAINTKTISLLNTDKPANTDSDWSLATLKTNPWATVQDLLPKGAIEDVSGLTKVNQQKKLAWKYLSVGITGGMTLPRQLPVSESARDENGSAAEGWLLTDKVFSENRRNGFDAGLLLQYQVGKRWQLSGAVAYQQINYELTNTFFNANQEKLLDNNYGLDEFFNGGIANLEDTMGSINNPPGSNNALTDTIHFGNTAIKQKAIEYRLGANYVFRPEKKWRPYVGLSVSAMSLMQQELWGNIYDDDGSYDSELSGRSAANKISTLSIKPSSFRWNGALLSTGFQLAINKRLHWQMEAWYQQPFKTRSDQLYNLAGAKTGLLYRF